MEEDYIEIDGIKIYRDEILQWKDYYLHNSQSISKESEQVLVNMIISNILNNKKGDE